MCLMQIESVLQTKNRSEPAKNRFSVALFQSYGPLQIWAFQTCQEDFSKSIWARGFKLGQLIENDK